jgi:hypothetical protein
MSITEEWEVQNLTQMANFHVQRIKADESSEEKAQQAIMKADSLMKSNIQEVFKSYGLETIISFAETALKVPNKIYLSQEYLDLFFKQIQNQGQFLIRALILKATLKSMESDEKQLKASENVENTREALKCIVEAIKIISKNEDTKQNYSFLIYNISICVYNIIRPFFRKGWLNRYLDVIEEVDKLLESVKEPNHDWRTRYAFSLIPGLLGSFSTPPTIQKKKLTCGRSSTSSGRILRRTAGLRSRTRSYATESTSRRNTPACKVLSRRRSARRRRKKA